MITQQNIWAQLKDLAQNDIFEIVGTGVPIDGTTGKNIVGLGGFYVDSATGNWYVNTGTKTSPVWALELSTSLTTQIKTGSISSANLTGTSAGQFGHADGVVLVPAPGANKIIIPHLFYCSYVFATAAYTGGGTIQLNLGGSGGFAMTSTITAANSFLNAASRTLVLAPIATSGAASASINAALNFLSSAAFTQPGTAAGVAFWKLFYSVQVANAA